MSILKGCYFLVAQKLQKIARNCLFQVDLCLLTVAEKDSLYSSGGQERGAIETGKSKIIGILFTKSTNEWAEGETHKAMNLILNFDFDFPSFGPKLYIPIMICTLASFSTPW